MSSPGKTKFFHLLEWKSNYKSVENGSKEREKNLKTNQKIPTAHKRKPTPPFITTDLEQPQGLNAYFENTSQNAQGSLKNGIFTVRLTTPRPPGPLWSAFRDLLCVLKNQVFFGPKPLF